jgi:hypothetical protein
MTGVTAIRNVNLIPNKSTHQPTNLWTDSVIMCGLIKVIYRTVKERGEMVQ